MNRNLDVLRAVAVLCVLVSHFARHVLYLQKIIVMDVERLGHVGVLLFFVHTALVLLMSLDRQPETFGFYLRRIFRIYPLAIFTVLLVLAFQIPRGPDFAFRDIPGRQVLTNLLLIQGDHQSILGPLWTLPHELLMYLALPLVFVALRKNSTVGSAVALWFAGMAVGATLPAILGVSHYWLTYIPCFLCGAIAYQGMKSRHCGSLPAALFPVALALPAAAYVTFWSGDVPGALARDYALCLLIGLVLPLFREMSVSAITKAAHYVAKYSYGIYLLHFPIMWLAFYRLSVPMAARWAVFALLMVAGPVLAYHLLEAPMIEVGRKLASRRPVPAPQLLVQH